jgi:hypothetical protein
MCIGKYQYERRKRKEEENNQEKVQQGKYDKSKSPRNMITLEKIKCQLKVKERGLLWTNKRKIIQILVMVQKMIYYNEEVMQAYP